MVTVVRDREGSLHGKGKLKREDKLKTGKGCWDNVVERSSKTAPFTTLIVGTNSLE